MFRKFLSNLGVTDFLEKPFTDFDLDHKIIKFRKDYFRQKDLELIEIEADTDKLTGLANRRKMDEFLEALFTSIESIILDLPPLLQLLLGIFGMLGVIKIFMFIVDLIEDRREGKK